MQLFVDQLTNVDFSYLDPKRGLVGETWLAGIILDGTLDDQGMVCDFGIVKAKTRHWLDTIIDHCLLVPVTHPDVRVAENSQEYHIEMVHNGGDHILCTAPKSAITLVDADEISTESIAHWSEQQLRPLFPSTVKKLEVTFAPEAISGPFYHYSHGLKKHRGNCQRIAHGHRSKIEIHRNGVLATDDMKQWAESWHDIYLGTQADLTAEQPDTHYAFAYQADQGAFSLTLPRKQCYLMNTDTTVELIAQHIARQMKARYPDEQIEVRAFEGLAKGAICTV